MEVFYSIGTRTVMAKDSDGVFSKQILVLPRKKAYVYEGWPVGKVFGNCLLLGFTDRFSTEFQGKVIG